MNKAFSKKAEEASRKHISKNPYRSKHCFIEGVEFCDKKSPKQFTKQDLREILVEGIVHFTGDKSITVKNADISKWIKDYLKR